MKRTLFTISFVAAILVVGVAPSTASAQNGGRDENHVTDGPPPYQPQPTPLPPTSAPNPYGPPPYGVPMYGQTYPQGPKRLPYNEGDAVPAGYQPSTRARTGLVIGGSIVFGVFYGFTTLGAGASHNSDTNWLYVPVAGPVLYGKTLTGTGADVGRFFLWIDTLAQAAGATMLAVGVLVPKTELVRNDVARVYVSPLAARAGGGLALGGDF